MITLGRYGKTIVAVVTGAIGWASLVVSSAPTHITGPEWIVGATALATAVGVYSVANEPPAV